MIFTGYVFPDAPSISPYLEEPRTGPTSRFCASLAARLRCYVVAGYPERLPPHEVHKAQIQSDDGSGNTKEVDKVGANAAALYGPDGEFVGDYRKTNLYTTDMTWARAGTGFITFHLPPPLNVVSLAICMDLNVQPPAMWDLTLGPYEIAEYCIAQKTNLLVLLNAWLDSKSSPDEDTDWQTINYWATRLRPLWAKVAKEDAKAEADGHASSSEEGRKPGEELVVVVCNRCGEENGITFAGSSSLFSLTRGAGRPKLLYCMGRREEGLEVWTYPSQASQNGTV
ncbi:carbon-nitrogen hydrolase [Lentinus tigrinus ALCF2SS1-7]|uniref:Carbon-nitrogen hydrolase n=1 Tax=Lentinus tigrinus ALCF2SS1-6 TaxID=1328759 RepID=A0A5C2SG71_9APHY|nr:carbon-nitrogen hydrolase [Lentinus tigrinus ALCF2SS1-6]RPD77965.1 carbon-nitrogen hydrolase [Lentinus tigrinus ALCF2SS1-7]